ncbi:MAG: hypothetical protein GKS00_21695 [Alphaproteobacteria bacterium]|nr:hypothetical protein [Alphaproteobacteria bacterium]
MTIITGVVALIALIVIGSVFLRTIFQQSVDGRPSATMSLLPLEQERRLRAPNLQLQAAIAENAKRIGTLERMLMQTNDHPAPAGDQALSAFVTVRIELEKTREKIAALEMKIGAQTIGQDKIQHRLETILEGFDTMHRLLRNNADNLAKRQQNYEEGLSVLQRSVSGMKGQITYLSELARETKNVLKRETESVSPETVRPAIKNQPDSRADRTRKSGETVRDGVIAYKAGRYDDAFQIWKPLAQGGNARAQFHLGALYFEGRGVAEDLSSACIWLKRASTNGYCCAHTMLARVRDKMRSRIASGDASSARIFGSVCR